MCPLFPGVVAPLYSKTRFPEASPASVVVDDVAKSTLEDTVSTFERVHEVPPLVVRRVVIVIVPLVCRLLPGYSDADRTAAPLGSTGQGSDRAGQSGRVARRNQARSLRIDHLAVAPDVGADDRPSARHRLEQDDAERFMPGGR